MLVYRTFGADLVCFWSCSFKGNAAFMIRVMVRKSSNSGAIYSFVLLVPPPSSFFHTQWSPILLLLPPLSALCADADSGSSPEGSAAFLDLLNACLIHTPPRGRLPGPAPGPRSGRVRPRPEHARPLPLRRHPPGPPLLPRRQGCRVARVGQVCRCYAAAGSMYSLVMYIGRTG